MALGRVELNSSLCSRARQSEMLSRCNSPIPLITMAGLSAATSTPTLRSSLAISSRARRMPARSLSVLGINEIDAIGRVGVFDLLTVITAAHYALRGQIGSLSPLDSTALGESARRAGKSRDGQEMYRSYPSPLC